MQRPLVKWLLFAACLAVFLGVMGWITTRTLEMERQREIAEQEAQVQERVRLALWRMDSIAGALVARENARPASHYQPFFSPDNLITSKNTEIGEGQALTPSPLLGEPPEMVLLHFEIIEQSPMACTSPQVPTGENLQRVNDWYAVTPQAGVAAERLGKLKSFFQSQDAPENAGAPSRVKAPSVGREVSSSDLVSKPVAVFKADAQAPAPAMQTAASSQQGYLNEKELILRNNVVQSQIATEKLEANRSVPLKKVAPGTYVMESAGGSASPSSTRAKEKQAAEGRAETRTAANKPAPSKDSLADVASRYRADGAKPASPPASAPATAVPLDSLAGVSAATALAEMPQEAKAASAIVSLKSAEPPTDMTARWLNGELLLTRKAALNGVPRTQGVWLDWEKLRVKLLSSIHDLLPSASLSALSSGGIGLDPLSLASLPVRLAPGDVLLPNIASWSPLKRALAIAWGCLALASLAIGLVLNRAIVLSERRGAFVSAVTHELRTPLTTFRLYSEMLADDMVPRAETRREYLRTLCDESTRLTHLVENVLAYSRIERGRVAARVEQITLSGLLARIEPRLRKRAEEVGLELQVALPPGLESASIKTDAMGVEQILFNLVDNACKYAAPQSEPHRLELSLEGDAREIIFRVRDHGPGISKAQLKRLFQPFEKSASDAAHSAPGVGLGLALSRRLAREMGGDLRLESCEGKGACFAFHLPR
jgi:signal transduction histidine kinase